MLSSDTNTPRLAYPHWKGAGDPGLTRPEVLVLIAVAFLLLLGGGWCFLKYGSAVSVNFSLGSPPPPPLSMRTPLQTVAFPDGGSLLIDGIAESKLSFGTLSAPSGFNGSHGSHTSGLGSTANKMEATMKEVESKLVGMEFASTPGALVIACRLRASDGSPWKVDRQFWGQNLRSQKGQTSTTPDWEAMVEGAGNPDDFPEVLVQVSDGTGGWIFANGPCCFDGAPDGLSVLAFPVWSRSQAELEFRAVRFGQPPITWKMKNPVHPVSPASWPVDTMPRTIDDPEFELVFSGASAPRQAPGAVIPDFKFRSKIPGEENLLPDSRSLSTVCAEVQGALGTRSLESHFDLGNNYRLSAFSLPPDESLLRFVFSVSPTGYYRYPRTGMTPLVTATVSADGKSLSLDTSALTSHGFVSATADIKGKEGLVWNLKFDWRNAPESLAAERALLIDAGQPMCLVGNNPTSLGEARVTGRSASSSGGQSTLELTIRWRGIPRVEKEQSAEGTTTRYFDALPAPGETIVLGMVLPKPVQTFEFVIPRPVQEKGGE